ncbi:MAG: Gfo/Idh/MocA family oxidoreductase [Chloroflexota bacterium]
MTDKIRWGLLSTARINDKVIGPIQQAQRSDLVAVASRDIDKAQAYAKDKNIPKAYGSYEALLADDEIDVVYISLPNALHCEWTVKAAEAGKHVLCEKPITVTLDELDQVEDAAKANNVIVFEAFMYLHHPQTLKAQEMIRNGELGAIQTIQSWHHFYLPPEDSGNIRLSSDLSGGSLWDVGVYPVSAAISLAQVGPPNVVWATHLASENGVDLAMRGQMVFDNNIVAQISSGFRTPRRGTIEVIGEKAMIQIPEPWKPGLQGLPSQLILTRNDDTVETIDLPKPDPYLCEIEAMETYVLDGVDPVLPLSQSRDFLRTVLALYESARSGQVVAV